MVRFYLNQSRVRSGGRLERVWSQYYKNFKGEADTARVSTRLQSSMAKNESSVIAAAHETRYAARWHAATNTLIDSSEVETNSDFDVH